MAAAIALWAAPAAYASTTQQSLFQDDRLLTSANAVEQTQALDVLKLLGVDTIHTVVNWSRLAPTPDSASPPAGFDGSNPAAYPAGNWDPYDALVRGAAARGIKVMMSPAGPVPDWASGCKSNVNHACKPNAQLYGQFVAALAKRYGGSYVDEDQDQTALPRVTQWTIWNEPNLSAWLYPQSQGRGRNLVRVGAGIYRSLVYAATAALRANGHRHDLVLVGETAPIGGGSKLTPPVDFLLAMFCVDARGHRLSGRAATALRCKGARQIQAGGISHHPYSRGAGVPTGTKQKPGALTIGVIDRFQQVLRAMRHSKVAPRKRAVYFTEFGVTTNPPDGKFGVPLDRQEQYLNEVDYLAYQRPWIKSVSQFQLEDDTNLRTKTFQTGLMFGDGTVKPSLAAYRTPIFVVRRGSRTTIFGQARPGGSHTVQIQFAPPGGGFTTVATKKTNRAGYVLVRLRTRKGSWRIAWNDGVGTVFSRTAGAVSESSPSTPGVPPPGPGTPPAPPPPTGNPETPPPAGGGSTPVGLQYTLSVAVSGATPLDGGTVTMDPPGRNCPSGNTCQETYTSGTSVTLTATPSGVGQNVTWGGACAGTSGNRCTVTMDAAKSVTAQFHL